MGGLTRVGLFDRLFGRGGQSAERDGGIHLAVACDACGEVIRVRVNPTAELSAADGGEGYFVRKVLVGQRCFRPIEVNLRYRDLRGTLISREVSGGRFVDTEEPAAR